MRERAKKNEELLSILNAQKTVENGEHRIEHRLSSYIHFRHIIHYYYMDARVCVCVGRGIAFMITCSKANS